MDNRVIPARNFREQPVDFSDLVTHVPVGICEFLLNGRHTLVYGNHALYAIFGYTPEQMKAEMGNEVIRLFFAEDREKLGAQVLAAYHAGETGFQAEHRIVRRDGQVIWVLVSGAFSGKEEVSAYGVVVDITDRKQMEERLRIDEERFRLALAQTENTIFDYDIATKAMMHADKSAGLYGLRHETYNVPDYLVEEKIVHPDSAAEYLEMYRLIRAGEKTASCVVRAKTVNGRYAWRRITMTNIFDQMGNAVRAVGMLEDIDEQTRREERLLERSQIDPLTKLYNKGATECRIRMLLEQENCCGVLFIIDIDSFKGVNDHYGHLFGDLVLEESAYRIASLCRHEDVIGRIGGDEFLLYLDGAFNKEAALKKAGDICAAFEEDFFHNGIGAHITCTVGFALCPYDGIAFEVLYQKADIALYEAKRNGKNRCCRYDECMNDHMEWVPYSNTEIDKPVAAKSLPQKNRVRRSYENK